MLAQIGLGIGALGALVFTARNFYLAQEGQVVDRYTRAVEQLGSEKVDVRLGGIFALERIMVDSPRDHDTVIQLLATFISEHAKLAQKDSSDDTSTVRWLLPPTPTRLSRINRWRPPADIRAALTVLGRRPRRAERDSLNLSGADLRGARLEGARLHGIDLTGADLREADLSTADMEKAVLVMADLRTAILRSTNLQGAYLPEVDLRGAILFGADLRGADLCRAHLEDARLDAASTPTVDRDPAGQGGAGGQRADEGGHR
jgi:Pentapeptide repeats (8 copies)